MKFSIIICTYNSAQRLPKTLDSILAQTSNDYEVVIIDGASTDGTVDVLKKYAEKFARKPRWISEKDRGIYDAMNKGVKMASGEFLSVIGAGDWLEKDALEKASDFIEKNPQADAVFGKTRIWESDLKTSRIVQTTSEMLAEYPMQHPSLFYKKTLHEKFGLYDENYKIVADYVFCLKAFYVGKVKATSFDNVVDNFVMDGASSKNNFKVLLENVRARKDCGVRTQMLRELKVYLKNLYK